MNINTSTTDHTHFFDQELSPLFPDEYDLLFSTTSDNLGQSSNAGKHSCIIPKPTLRPEHDANRFVGTLTASQRYNDLVTFQYHDNDAMETTAITHRRPSTILPRENDVIGGRGNRVNNYSGNAYLRAVVKALKPSYVQMPKAKKPMIAKAVISHLSSLCPPARFLKYDFQQNQWTIMDEKKALDKVRQALRENLSSMKNQVLPAAFPVVSTTSSIENVIMDTVYSILNDMAGAPNTVGNNEASHYSHERMPTALLGPTSITTSPLKRSEESKKHHSPSTYFLRDRT
jgi:hypothetical protein